MFPLWYSRRIRLNRRGMSTTQTALVLVLIASAVFVAARNLSTNTSSDMEVTAEGIADPAKLTERFSH